MSQFGCEHTTPGSTGSWRKKFQIVILMTERGGKCTAYSVCLLFTLTRIMLSHLLVQYSRCCWWTEVSPMTDHRRWWCYSCWELQGLQYIRMTCLLAIICNTCRVRDKWSTLTAACHTSGKVWFWATQDFLLNTSMINLESLSKFRVTNSVLTKESLDIFGVSNLVTHANYGKSSLRYGLSIL